MAQAVLLPTGKQALLSAFPPVHPTVKAHHMTVCKDPQGKTLAQLATAMGRPVDINVIAVVSDAKCQAAVVEVSKTSPEDDGGIPVPVENFVAHITLSLADGVPAVYSNELLERVLLNGNGFLMDWEGTYADGSKVSVRVPREPVRLEASLCLSDMWDEEHARCGKKKECGFCLFMKLGPCGSEFEKWEACIESCKDGQDDFVDKCAEHTLVLKSCVDAHPEYYYSLLDAPAASSESSTSEVSAANSSSSSSSSPSEGGDATAPAEAPLVNPPLPYADVVEAEPLLPSVAAPAESEN